MSAVDDRDTLRAKLDAVQTYAQNVIDDSASIDAVAVAMGVCRLLGYRWTTPEVAPLHTESICTSDLGSACLNELCPHRVCTTCRQKWPCEGSGKR